MNTSARYLIPSTIPAPNQRTSSSRLNEEAKIDIRSTTRVRIRSVNGSGLGKRTSTIRNRLPRDE